MVRISSLLGEGKRIVQRVLMAALGGGYVQPASPAHFTYLHDLTTTLNKITGSPKISVLLLAYTLAPDAVYPTQLAESATLISYLLKAMNRSPSSLILAGDSAGGNLLCGLISHILHPHPNAVGRIPVINLNEPFRAVILLSPWVSFQTNHPSYVANAETDIFDDIPLKLWSDAFLGESQRHGILMGDSYSEPLLAEPSWWSRAHEIANDVLIWGGSGEVFIDGIRAFSEKFREGFAAGGGDSKNVVTIEGEGMAHEEMVLDFVLGYKEKGKGALQVEDWVKSKL
jgi:acetyl esterase/lipase